MASARRFGVVVAGCGGISHCHTYALTRIPEVRLVATVDIDESRARAFKEQYRAETHGTDLGPVLERDDVDAVVVTTANDTHAPLSIQALEAGKHVLVQKPIALTLAEADRMIETAERRRRKLTAASAARSSRC